MPETKGNILHKASIPVPYSMLTLASLGVVTVIANMFTQGIIFPSNFMPPQVGALVSLKISCAMIPHLPGQVPTSIVFPTGA